MKKHFMKNLKKNRGTALLFALGILSVIMVMAMLFASKAKVHSRISGIQQTNQAARNLAKSLIPRIMITLNKNQLYQDNVLFSSTYDDDLDKNENGANILDPDSNDTTSLLQYDWLWKLESETAGVTFAGAFPYKYKTNSSYDTAFLPTWQYILAPDGRDKGWVWNNDANDNKLNSVLARFAFVTIPAPPTLNPNAIANHVYCRRLSNDSKKSVASDCRICQRRQGNSPAELFFTTTKGIKGDVDGASEYNTTNDTLQDIPIMNFGESFSATSTTKNLQKIYSENEYRNWTSIKSLLMSLGKSEKDTNYADTLETVEKIFRPNDGGDKEAFWEDDGGGNDKNANNGIQDSGEFYHRFNLRRTDWNTKNGNDYTVTVETICSLPKKWEALTPQEPDAQGGRNHDTGGIAWFANWGRTDYIDSNGKDGAIDDTDEGKGGGGLDSEDDGRKWETEKMKRDQIAANLINYCANASRPSVSGHYDSTGDDHAKVILPHEWKTKEPHFTGLKRTLYINEFFYLLNVDATVVSHEITPGTHQYTVNYNWDSKFITELVDMYLNTLGDKNNSPKDGVWPDKECDFSAYEPVVYGTLSFKVKDPDPSKSDTWDNVSVELKNETAQYMMNHADYNTNEKAGYFGYIYEKTEKEEYSFTANANLTVDTKIKDVKFEIDRILLKRKFISGVDVRGETFPETDDLGDEPDYEYVDCAILNTETSLNSGDNSEISITPGTAGYIAYQDFEVDSDPRMNLRKADWKIKDAKVETNIATAFDTYYSNLINKANLNGSGPTLPIGATGINSTVPTTNNQKSTAQNYDYEKNGINEFPRTYYNPAWLRGSGSSSGGGPGGPGGPGGSGGTTTSTYNGIKADAAFSNHISTAFIRHAILKSLDGESGLKEYPMESVWELGAIHRAGHWQTLNIARCNKSFIKNQNFINIGGLDYKYGDAPLLDQVKMCNDTESMGKINISRISSMENLYYIYGSLFLDMPIREHGNYIRMLVDNSGDEVNMENHGESEELLESDQTGKDSWLSHITALNCAVYGKTSESGSAEWDGLYKNTSGGYQFYRRSDLLAVPYDEGSEDFLYPIRMPKRDASITDAKEEQRIGRFINLVKVEPGVQSVKAVLLVQMIQDSGDMTMVRDWNGDGVIKDSGGKAVEFQSGFRRFSDAGSSTAAAFVNKGNLKEVISGKKSRYDMGADSIVGEAKVLVNLEFDSVNRKWSIVSYEYID